MQSRAPGSRRGKSIRIWRKWVVSFKYEWILGRYGLRKISMSDDIFSVGQPLAETMGRQGTGILFLCILGRRYKVGVRASKVRSLRSREVVISFFNLRELMKRLIFWLLNSVGSKSKGL